MNNICLMLFFSLNIHDITGILFIIFHFNLNHTDVVDQKWQKQRTQLQIFYLISSKHRNLKYIKST